MSELVISIFNVLTMLCLILCAGYLSAELAEQRISLFKRLVLCLVNWSCKPLDGLKPKIGYLLFYIIIPSLIGHVLMIARQFRIGKMYIRADFSFVLGFSLWVSLPLFLMWILNKLKKEQSKNK